MNLHSNKQTLYIRKLNGLGQKIHVQDSLTIIELKHILKSLKSLQTSSLKDNNFHLIFKGKNITDKSQSTLKQLGIPSDGIVHLVFVTQQQKNQPLSSLNINNMNLNQNDSNNINVTVSKPIQINIRVFFNGQQHQFLINQHLTVLDLKKKIANKLNLIFQSLVLSHLGTQMLNQKQLSAYEFQNNTLISVKFNLQKPQKKKLQSRMVSSVTFSDQNNQPNANANTQQFQPKSKLATSSKSFNSNQQEQSQKGPQRLTSLLNSNTRPMMYKSDINSFQASKSQGASKAAMMFKNALHQKIVETQSVVSGSFSQDASVSGCDPNHLLVTVKNEQQTRQYVLECLKTHQILNIRQRLLQLQRIQNSEKIQISMQEDLFQSIDLNKSGCVTLNEIVKKMGKQRAVFIYRII